MHLRMSVWASLGIAAAAFFVVGTAVAFAVATILGRIADHLTRLAENDVRSSAPLARDEEGDKQTPGRALPRPATGRRF